ncbi:MAG: hypothetical protein HPY74_06135 [Firmicutes bacterium]|nr:hypothetical protein [Bacillota bacterium]
MYAGQGLVFVIDADILKIVDEVIIASVIKIKSLKCFEEVNRMFHDLLFPFEEIQEYVKKHENIELTYYDVAFYEAYLEIIEGKEYRKRKIRKELNISPA